MRIINTLTAMAAALALVCLAACQPNYDPKSGNIWDYHPEEYQKRQDAKKAKLKQAEGELKQTQSKTSELLKQINAKESELKELDARLDEAGKKLAVAKKELTIKKGKHSAAVARVKELESKRHTLQQEIQQTKLNRSSLTEAQLKETLNRLEQEMNELEEEILVVGGM